MAKKKKKDEEPEDEDDKSRGSKKKLLIAGAVGIAVYMFFFRGGGSESDAAVTTTTLAIEDELPGEVVDVGVMTVNLADNEPRFARVGVAIVLVDGADPAVVEAKLALVKDALLTQLATYTANDILGIAGQELLRRDLTTRAREIYNVDDARVVIRVVFTELLVQ